MRNFGMFIVGVSLVWLVVAFQMNTAVWTGGETIGSGEFARYIPRQQVYNLGLAEVRRNHLMLAGLGLIAGTILIGFGTLNARNGERFPCPECAELIRAEASKCRFCGASIPDADEESEISESVGQTVADEFGIVRNGDKFYFLHLSFNSLDESIAYAQAHGSASGA